MMEAGKYYIGDLCYVMHDVWREVCDLTLSSNTVNEGEFTLKSGVKFAMYNTLYGDGTYPDQFGNEYGVDAGVIGCILIDDIDLTHKDNDINLGHTHFFEKDFITTRIGGDIFIGNVCVSTDYEDDDEDNYLEEEIEFEPED